MAYLSYIVTAVAVVFASIFALLLRFWTGFAYFVLAVLLLLSLFWGIWLTLKYRTEFMQELEERFKRFKAETLNKNNVTPQYFEENSFAFEKEFKKKVLKDKLIKIFIILFCFACAAAFLTGMIFYK